MISQIVEIVESTPDYLVVKPQKTGCQSCSSGSCGVTNFANLFGKQSHSLKISNTGEFQVGDIAELLLDEAIFMRSVFVQYLLPLFGMFLFVLAATFVSSGLVIQLLGAILGLVAGVLASKYLIRWYESRLDDEHLQIRHPVS